MGKILVIEDEASILEGVLDILVLEGYEACTARDGLQGIALAQQERPDLILCDIRMPQADGYQVFNTLQNYPATADIPFVFMTAKANDDDIQHITAKLAADYLSKPFTLDELLTLVRAKLDC